MTGRSVREDALGLLIHQYSDGTVEKRVRMVR
jgi:hypothetical protein